MQNRNYDTKQILEVGLMTALTIIFMFIVNYIPIFDLLASVILPLPIIILYIRHDLKIALLSILLSLILMALFFNPLSAITSVILISLLGLTMGYCIKNKKGVIKTIIYQGIASAVGTILKIVFMMKLILKTNLDNFISKSIIEPFKESLELTKGLYGGMGVDVESNPMYQLIQNIDVKYILMCVPAILIISSMVTAYINYVVTKAVLKRMGYKFESMRPFAYWYLDNRIGAAFIIIVCAGVILNSLSMEAGRYLLTSGIMILQIALLIDGLAVITFIVQNIFKGKKNFIWLIVLLVLFIQPLLVFAVMLGLTDMIMDIRKIDPNSLHNSLLKKFKK